jgi:hypothetical protein
MKPIAAGLTGVWMCALASVLASSSPSVQQPQNPQAAQAPPKSAERALLDRYCVGCHNQRTRTANLTLDLMDPANVGAHAAQWEKVVRKLRGGQMPPTTAPKPPEGARDGLIAFLETSLDSAGAANPNPGRTETFHRLNRAEYHNAVRDILALDLDVSSLLPGDSASYGFDNIAGVLKVSESLMERYLTAARKISRAAVGDAPPGPGAQTYTVSPALLQDDRVEGLPFGTRGGTRFTHIFPQDAEYVFRFDLANLANPADMDFLIDGERVQLFAIKGGGRSTDADGNEQNENLEARLRVNAGPREVAAAFLKSPRVLSETNRRPFMNPTVSRPANVALRSITITGPFAATGSGETPSRKRIFSCRPANAAGEDACSRTILSTLARRAFRRPVDDDDIKIFLTAYADGRRAGTFDSGIERGIQQLLVSPEFLFRVAGEPAKPAALYRISDLELASRLSFFLWSSVPDDELIDVAAKGQLKNAATLERQVRRMIADPRSEALTANFAGQWLQLRNITLVKPSEVLFPDFDDTLRQGFKRETELFFDSILRDDRSALDLLSADYTFLNERLARHYGIANVSGSHFRRVTLADETRRGLLGHGSILTMTSQPVRTSPVFRGKWILDNILGTPPPDPPPNVPPLPEKSGVYAGRAPSMRERMSEHRENPACASCHSMIDPLGFGLENFDPIGKWREVDEMYVAIDASGALPDGTRFTSAAELRAALLKRPDRFVSALTEKLLTYALGRGVEYYDMPAVRKIVKDAAANRYQLSAIILGITRSLPFQQRRAES